MDGGNNETRNNRRVACLLYEVQVEANALLSDVSFD
jgi:hypothetical protein